MSLYDLEFACNIALVDGAAAVTDIHDVRPSPITTHPPTFGNHAGQLESLFQVHFLVKFESVELTLRDPAM